MKKCFEQDTVQKACKKITVCVAVFLLSKTKSNTVTLYSLKTKQGEVEFLAATWGLALGMSSNAAAQQGSCRARMSGQFLFLFSLFSSIFHVLCSSPVQWPALMASSAADTALVRMPVTSRGHGVLTR